MSCAQVRVVRSSFSNKSETCVGISRWAVDGFNCESSVTAPVWLVRCCITCSVCMVGWNSICVGGGGDSESERQGGVGLTPKSAQVVLFDVWSGTFCWLGMVALVWLYCDSMPMPSIISRVCSLVSGFPEGGMKM